MEKTPPLEFATEWAVPENLSLVTRAQEEEWSKLQRWISATFYFRHSTSLDVRDVVALHNSAVGGGIQGTASPPNDGIPARRSPRASLKRHFVLDVPGKVSVCGPDLRATLPGRGIAESGEVGRGFFSGTYMGGIDADAKVRDFGDYLLVAYRSNPSVSPLCGGAGGCNPKLRFETFKVSLGPPLRVHKVFEYEGFWTGMDFIDVYMDSDWSKIYKFEGARDRDREPISWECKDYLWTKTTFCRHEATGEFARCAVEGNVPMPQTIGLDLFMECDNGPQYVPVDVFGQPES